MISGHTGGGRTRRSSVMASQRLVTCVVVLLTCLGTTGCVTAVRPGSTARLQTDPPTDPAAATLTPLPTTPGPSAQASRWPSPLSSSELSEIRRQLEEQGYVSDPLEQRIGVVKDAIRGAIAYARSQPDSGGVYIDVPTNNPVFLFVGDAEKHRPSLAQALPPGWPFQLRSVEYTYAALNRAQEVIDESRGSLRADGIAVALTALDERSNRVRIELERFDATAAQELRRRFGPVVYVVRPESAGAPSTPPATPPAPALHPGSDWRLLLDDQTSHAFGGSLDAAANRATYERLWRQLGRRDTPRRVDFAREIVIFFHVLVSPGCPTARLRALHFDRSENRLYGTFEHVPETHECVDTGAAQSFVVAVSRAAVSHGVLSIRLQVEYPLCTDRPCGPPQPEDVKLRL